MPWTSGRRGSPALKERAAQEGRTNLKALLAPAGQVPMEDRSVDVGFMATVLHDLVEAGTATGALMELTRVLKPGGLLAIVEFDKIDGPPGPPRHIRLDPAGSGKPWWPLTASADKRPRNWGLTTI